MFYKKTLATLTLAIFAIMAVPFQVNASRMRPKDRDKNKVNSQMNTIVVESEHIKLEDNSPDYAYNILVKNSGKWIQTTGGQKRQISGYKIKVLIDNVGYDITNMQIGVEKEIIPDVTLILNATLINQGQFIKIEYVIKNYSNISYKIDIATYSNILIDNENPTKITPFTNGFGFKAVQESTKDLELNFIVGKNSNVTNIDSTWCGKKGDVDANLFSSGRCCGCSGDVAIAYAWKNKELLPNSNLNYSTLVGVGQISGSPKILVTTPSSLSNIFYTGRTYDIKGLVFDTNNIEKTQVYYSIDDGDEVLAYTFDDEKCDFTSSFKISPNLSEDIHRIEFFAKDKYGMISNTQIVLVIVKKDTCTVTFESNGGGIVEDFTKVSIGSKISPPKLPIKQGFDFAGWYKDSECNYKWDFENDKVEEDTKLYAKWKEQTATVSQIPSQIINPDLVSITALQGTFNESVEMRLVYDSNYLDLFRKHLKFKNLFALDIDIFSVNTGAKVQPNEGKSVQITLPVPKELLHQKDKIKVAFLKDNEIEFLNSEIVFIDDVYCIRFFANHFSMYAFYIEKDIEIIKDDKTPKAQSPTAENTAGKIKNAYDKKTPKTSDDTNTFPLFICLISSGIAFFIIKGKKQ